MDNEHDVKIAVDAIKQIMEEIGIVKVVSVDDYYSKDINIEAMIALVCDESTEAYKLIPGLDFDDIKDSEVVRSKLNRLKEHDALDFDSIKQIIQQQQDNGVTNEYTNMTILRSLFSPDVFNELTLSEWEKSKESLLDEARHHKTLFLFDQDFGDEYEKHGIRIISGLLSGEYSQVVICGLLTHTVAPEKVLEAKENLAADNGILDDKRDQFLVISKQHLSQDPILFAQILKLLALSPDFAKLKRDAISIYNEALNQAKSDIEQINIYDLDHIVFKTSAVEGLWEPDMVFRLYAMFHRLRARALAYDTKSLEATAQKMRKVSQIPAKCKTPFMSNIWKIQRKEYYDQGEFINKNHLPLETGDIFKKNDSDSSKYFILLSQPCDLMIRGSGKREPELEHLILAEVTKNKPKYGEVLEYFDVDPNKTWYVNLKRIHYVWACILDMCVFNEDGQSKMTLDSEISMNLRPAWKKRYDHINKRVKAIIRKLNKKIGPKDEYDDFITNSQFHGKYKKAGLTETVEFNCKRECRLSKERAFGLLMAYTSVLGRPGYEADFVRE